MIENDIPYPDNLDASFAFRSFGVTFTIECNSHEFLSETQEFLHSTLAGHVELIRSGQKTRFSVSILVNPDGTFDLFRDRTFNRTFPEKEFLYRDLSSNVRLKIGEFADKVLFVHAGVVRLNGKGIMFPANSQLGKTTLVKELIGLGAEYYSDEYAVFDEAGLCHPFARPLSVRTNTALLKVPPEELGAVVGTSPMQIDFVILTAYQAGSEWLPERLSTGNGIIETVPHAISMPTNARFAFKLLKFGLSRAIMLKGMRCDAKKFAPILKYYIEDLKRS